VLQALAPVDEGDVLLFATGQQLAALLTALPVETAPDEIRGLLSYVSVPDVQHWELVGIPVAPSVAVPLPTRGRSSSGTS
jgi:hypothetical protein